MPNAVATASLASGVEQGYAAWLWLDERAAGFPVAAVRAAEEAARLERERTGRPLLGRKAVLRARHTDRPSTVEPRRGLRPLIACKNEPRRIAELIALRAFRIAYRAALALFRGGERDAVFPAGSYGPRVLGLRCAPS